MQGLNMIKSIKSRKFILMAACVLFLLMVEIGNAGVPRKINCRKFVHAPQCRGIAAKRDTTRFTDDYRMFTGENEDKIVREKSLLNDFLRKLSDREPDYEPENYLK